MILKMGGGNDSVEKIYTPQHWLKKEVCGERGVLSKYIPEYVFQ